MPLHDFRCLKCGAVQRDLYRSVHEGATFDPPTCEDCHDGTLMIWIPALGAVDCYEPSDSNTVEDYRGNQVRIESLADIRRLERESEKMSRDGIGSPMRFRHYSQDASNRDVGLFGPDPALKPNMKKISITKHGGERPEVVMGPGAVENSAIGKLEG